FVPNARSLERFDRPGLINVNNSVKLFWEARVKIMAEPFRFGPINHADRAFEPRAGQRVRHFSAQTSQIDPEASYFHFMKKFFVAAPQCRPHIFALSVRAPIGSRGHAAMVRAKTN